jgi:hypothetical protein
MGKGFSSTNFVHLINGLESDSKEQQAGPDPDHSALSAFASPAPTSAHFPCWRMQQIWECRRER